MAFADADRHANRIQQIRITCALNKILKGSQPKVSSLFKPNRNSPEAAVDYFNRYLVLGIDFDGQKYISEEANVCILHDLAHFPLEMVLERIRRDLQS